MTPTPVAAPEAGSHPTQRTSSPATERRGPVALLALTAVVAAHVVDDSFLQPPAGTAAADHLVSGLVLLAVLAVAAAICLRVRPGAAGATAVGTGVLGVTVGAIEAGYSTATSGPSGDDVTGLLAAAAGLGLVGIGTLQLWRSRRGGGRVRRYGRRVLKTAAALVAVQVVFYPVGFSYVSTHVARAHVPAADLGAAYEDVTLRTSDGLDLQGWYVPSRNGAAVLAFPGRLGPQAHARMLARHGYGVLLLDRRGEGASEGAPNMFGWDGERDVHAAVAFLRGREDVDASRIGGLGLSVGGEMLLHAAAENAGLAAVVSEGAGTRSLAEEQVALDRRTFWAMSPILAVKQAALVVLSGSAPPDSLVDLVPRIAPRPVLLIASPNSPNLERVNRVYRRLVGPSAALWELPEAGHVQGLATRPDEYERRVVAFFDRALPASGAPGSSARGSR